MQGHLLCSEKSVASDENRANLADNRVTQLKIGQPNRKIGDVYNVDDFFPQEQFLQSVHVNDIFSPVLKILVLSKVNETRKMCEIY